METKEGKERKKGRIKMGSWLGPMGPNTELEVSYGKGVEVEVGGMGAKEDGETWVVTIAEATFFFSFVSSLFCFKCRG